MNWTWFHRLGIAAACVRLRAPLGAVVRRAAAVLRCCVALYGGLVLAPADYQQKDAFRIVYVHAPAAWLSLMSTRRWRWPPRSDSSGA